MKKNYVKIAVMALVSIFLLTSVPQAVFANKTMQKHLDREFKRKMKEYRKEGWKLAGSSRSLEVTLLQHYEKLNANPDLLVIEGVATQCRSLGVCSQVALNDAQNYYARLVSGKIQGAFGTIIRANDNRPQDEINKMVGGLLNEIEADLSGILTPSYSIVRENGANKSYKTYFFVDTQKVGEMIGATLERSIKETKLTIEEARSISRFVQEELKREQQ